LPIVHKFRPEHNLVVSVWTGTVPDAEALASYAELYAHEKWIPGMDELADLRNADMTQITTDGLRGIAKLVREAIKGHGVEFRSAVIASDELAQALIRLYGAINEESKEDACVFQTVDAAVEWLGVPEEVLED
jgi:ribosome modulation factor